MNEQVNITAINNPVSGEPLKCVVEPGKTISELFPEVSEQVEIEINGELLPREEYDSYELEHPDLVEIKRFPAGSQEQGKNVARTAAYLAVAVASTVATSGIAGPGAGAGLVALEATAAAAINVAGAWAVGKIFPYQDIRNSQTDNDEEFNRMGALTGSQNRLATYKVVPRIYGKHKLYPPMSAQPYTEVTGNQQFMRLLFNLGPGPLQLSDPKIGETSIGSFDADNNFTSNDNYESVKIDVAEQPALYSKDINEVTPGVDLNEQDDSAIRTTVADTDEASLDFTFPRGLFFTSPDATEKANVNIRIEYREVGSSTWINALEDNTVTTDYVRGEPVTEVQDYFKIESSAKETYRAGLNVELPQSGQYEFRVTRLNVAGGTNRIDQCVWSAFRSIKHEKPTDLPGTVQLAMRIKSTDQLTGILDNFSVVAESRLDYYDGSSWQTTSYNPDNGSGSGGKLTSNPAWVFADILTGDANARAIGKDRLDGDALKAWADWCNTEGFEYNGVIDSETTVMDLVRSVASAGQASYGLQDGDHTVVRDLENQTPVQMFTPRNMKAESFRSTKTFLDAPHALKVQFKNATSDWETEEAIVYRDGYSSSNATRFETLQLDGVTSWEQAWRMGRYRLAESILRPEVYTLEVDIEHLIAQRGDLVKVAHDVTLWGSRWGRIKSVTRDGSNNVTEIELDEPAVMETGNNYQIRVRTDENSFAVIDVDTVDGESQTVTVSSPADHDISKGDLFAFGEQSTETVNLKIIGIEPQPDLSARLTLVDEAPAIHKVTDAPFDFEPSDVDTTSDVIDVDPIFEFLYDKDHPFSDGDQVQLTTTGTLPSPLSTGTDYYIVNSTSEDFQLSSSLGGTAIDLTDSGSGTHTAIRQIPEFDPQITDPVNIEEDVTPPTPTIDSIRSDQDSGYREDDGSYRLTMLVSFSVAQGQPSLEVEGRYTATDTDEGWSQLVKADANLGVLRLENVERGKGYTIQIRSRYNGKTSPWSGNITHTVQGKQSNPSDVAGYNVIVDKAVMRHTWDEPSDPDIEKFEIRTDTNWGASDANLVGRSKTTILTSEIPGAGDVTYYIKAIDTHGNYSTSAGSDTVNVDSKYTGDPAYEGDYMERDFSNVSDWTPADSRYLNEASGLSEITTIQGAKTFDSDVTIGSSSNGADLHVFGNIFQDGDTYETHVEQLYTEKDFIISRDGAQGGLPAGEISGLQVNIADGTNDVVFGVDNSAIARVGWMGDTLQAVATRPDSPDDTGIGIWNSTENWYETSPNLTFDGSVLDLNADLHIEDKLIFGGGTADTTGDSEEITAGYHTGAGSGGRMWMAPRQNGTADFGAGFGYDWENDVWYSEAPMVIANGQNDQGYTGANIGGTTNIQDTLTGVDLDMSSTGEFGGLLTAQAGIVSEDDVDVTGGSISVDPNSDQFEFIELLRGAGTDKAGIRMTGIAGQAGVISGRLDGSSVSQMRFRDGDIALFDSDLETFDFSAGSTGWQISYAGDGELESATIRDTLDVAGPSGLQGLVTVHDDIYPNTNYLSNIGAPQKKFLSAHIAELRAEIMTVAERKLVSGGRVNVATGEGVLTSDIGISSSTIIVDTNGLSNGDILHFEKVGQVEFMKVTSAATDLGNGNWEYDVTRDLDGSGANSWLKGDGFLNTGTTGAGFIDMYAVNSLKTGVSTAGPTTAYMERTGTGYNDISVRSVSGNMKGWYDYTTDIYGAGFGDESAENITIDPTNGFRVRNASNVAAQLSGTIFTVGDATNYIQFDVSDSSWDSKMDTYHWDAPNLSIDSTYGIEVANVHEILNDGSFDFAGGLLTGTTTTLAIQGAGASIDVSDFDLSATNILINSANDRAKFGDATTYIDWNNGTINAVLDEFDVSINANNSIVANGSGVSIFAEDYLLQDVGSNLVIDSTTPKIDIGDSHTLNGNTDVASFSSGLLTADGGAGSVILGDASKSDPYLEAVGTSLNAVGMNLDVTSLPRVSDDRLVGHWRFERSTQDATGNSDSSNESGSYVEGVSGRAFQGSFDSTFNPSDAIGSDDFYISFWVTVDGGAGTRRGIIHPESGAPRFYVDVRSGDYLQIGIASTTFITNFTPTIGTRYKIGIEVNRSGNAYLYVDYELQDSISDSGLGDPLRDGTIEIGDSDLIIEELRIYERLLVNNQRKALYLYPSGNSGGLISTETLVAEAGFFDDLFSTNANVTGGALTLDDGAELIARDSSQNTFYHVDPNADQWYVGDLTGSHIEWMNGALDMVPDTIEVDTGGGFKSADFYLNSAQKQLSFGSDLWLEYAGGQGQIGYSGLVRNIYSPSISVEWDNSSGGVNLDDTNGFSSTTHQVSGTTNDETESYKIKCSYTRQFGERTLKFTGQAKEELDADTNGSGSADYIVRLFVNGTEVDTSQVQLAVSLGGSDSTSYRDVEISYDATNLSINEEAYIEVSVKIVMDGTSNEGSPNNLVASHYLRKPSIDAVGN